MTALSLFVYGTLKRGHSNHARYAGGYCAASPATLRGRLYLLPVGYPILVVPPESILAHGTDSPEVDARTQADWHTHVGEPLPAALTADGWPSVHGEIFTYEDPAAHLPQMDVLEDFHPGRESLYLRVLVRTIEPQRTVWVYVAPPGAVFPAGTRPIDAWPERPGA